LRHIYANFQSAGFKGEELKKHIFDASYSYTKSGFQKAMELLRRDCEEAHNWMMQIPVEAWCRHAFDTNCKTDLVVNNLSEVFNKMILDVRGKPIRTMLDGIKDKLMVKYSKIRQKTKTTRWEITPFYAKKLEEAKKHSRECKAKNADIGLWQVSTKGTDVHAVDLRARTCGCKAWDLTGIPCNHAISVISKIKQHPEDYVHDFFKKDMYREAFKHVIYPVPGPDEWPKTDTRDIDPPVFREKPGRKQTVRRKGVHEMPAPRDSSRMGSITCSNCKLVGHRFPSCPMQLKPELQLRKNKHQVSMLHMVLCLYILYTSYISCTLKCFLQSNRETITPGPRAPAPSSSTAPRAPGPSSSTASRASPAPRENPAGRPFFAPRTSGREPKLTHRMQGYLNAGKHSSYKGSRISKK